MPSLPRRFPLFLFLVMGCSPSPIYLPAPPTVPPVAEPGRDFDASRTATVTGRVVWEGPIPDVPKLDPVQKDGGDNPHKPQVNPTNRGVRGAVVYLRNMDPARGRPWDHPPVRVEFDAKAIRLLSGNSAPQAVGFVRRGDSVEMTSTEAGQRMLRARGAAFFTLSFPAPGQPLSRPFERPGVVNLTSGSGEYWEAATLFVCDHPYYTLTDEDGGFRLLQVPFGDYELVTWMPNWNVTGQDRSPETGIVVRVRFAEPVESVTGLTVNANPAPVNMVMNANLFRGGSENNR